IQRAEDKTQQMQARAGAVDELIASGALDDATLPGGKGDDIQAELDRGAASNDVELELAKLKGELPAGGSTPAIAISGEAASAAPEPAPDAASGGTK
ncbi:MAG: PspA/IM30 family protein, partial [Mycobacteriales bacterium]